jgi:hypothetical protein
MQDAPKDACEILAACLPKRKFHVYEAGNMTSIHAPRAPTDFSSANPMFAQRKIPN